MSNLTRKAWPLGWRPSDDRTNGNRDGLLRMENLCNDENGVLSLVRGTQKVNTASLGGAVHTCYSKFIFNSKYRYAALSTGEIQRGLGSSFTLIASGGSSSVATFGSTLGKIIACSGSQRKIDDGTNVYDITPAKSQTALTLNPNSQPTNEISSGTWASWTLEEGGGLVNGSDYVQFNTDGSTFRGVVKLDSTASPINTKVTGSSDPLPEDNFLFNVRVGNTTNLDSVRIEFILDDFSVPGEYYFYEWGLDNFNQGINAWTTLSALRREFTRHGSDGNYDWNNVIGIRVILNGKFAAISNNIVNTLRFVGGEQGQLNDYYEYMQVNVYNTGSYFSKSEMGVVSGPVLVQHGSINITPDLTNLDPQVNEIWIYRRSALRNEDLNFVLRSTPKLDQWYRVLIIESSTGFAAADDNLSDFEALTLNITYNEALLSVKDYPDEMLGIVTDYYDRTIYMTFKEVLLSDQRDPGLIDSTVTLKLSGDSTGKNLWIKKVDANTLYIGTTSDIFELRGTLNLNPDGTIDAISRPLGIKHIPISSDVDANEGVLYYVSDEGIKILQGSQNAVISDQFNALFQGKTRYGIAPIAIYPNDNAVYPIALTQQKLWISIPFQDGRRIVLVYDTKKQYWYPWMTNPIALWAEEDGTLLAGYDDGYLREMNIGSTLDGLVGQRVVFETIADDDDLPRNRKDLFTFKINADTGGANVEIFIAKNGSEVFQSIGSTSFNGKTERLISIAETIGMAKQVAIRIVGDNLTTFYLYNFTVEYDPRPEQLTYLRIPNINLGTISRKRFTNFAFSIDTVGETCEFFPLIDNVVQSPSSTFAWDGRQTHIHYFTSEKIGTDIGGIICGFFEFYGPHLEEIVSEKLPIPVKYLVIPANDYGVPNRKRHSSYKFQINTRGANVRFTPILDGVSQTPQTYNTTTKRTVEYFFTTDTIAIDIGGILETLADTPFEFYGVIVPQHIEQLPPRLKEYYIPENNYGIAARKRIRTMPMEINTNGENVTFTPIIDGATGTPTTINTSTRKTAFHYFNTDVFGVDFAGEIVGSEAFEFYGLLKPENVEVLPVGKKFDQIGPFVVDRLGKVLRLRLRIITGERDLVIKLLTETEVTIPNMTSNTGIWHTTLPSTPNIDDVYEIIVPKSMHGTVFRVELGPTTEPFHRYDLTLLFKPSGMESDAKWLKLR